MSFFKIKDPNGSYKIANGSIISTKIGSKDAEPEVYTRDELMDYIDNLVIISLEYDVSEGPEIVVNFTPFSEKWANTALAYKGSIDCVLLRKTLRNSSTDAGGHDSWPSEMSMFPTSPSSKELVGHNSTIVNNYTHRPTKIELTSGRLVLTGFDTPNEGLYTPYLINSAIGSGSSVPLERCVGLFKDTSIHASDWILYFKAGFVGRANKSRNLITNCSLKPFEINIHDVL